MPRSKFNQSGQGGRKGQKKFQRGNNFKKNAGQKRKAPEIDRGTKKYKFIRRNQESEEALRRQRQLERNYDEKNPLPAQEHFGDVESSSEEELDPMEQLMSTLAAGGQNVNIKTNDAIESSEESGEDEASDEQDEIDGSEEEGESNDEVGDDDEDDDDIFPEKFEEQSQPRGRLYRSSDEDNEEEASEPNSDDDFPEDTILRPEESKDQPKFDDSFVSDLEDEDDKNSENESGAEDEEDNVEKEMKKDIFSIHLDNELSPDLLECVNTTHNSKTEYLNWTVLGRLQVDIPTVTEVASENSVKSKKKKLTLLDDEAELAAEGKLPTLLTNKNVDLKELSIKIQLQPNLVAANKPNLKDGDEVFTELQSEILSIANNYQDIYYPQRTHSNGAELQFIYCLHSINHILKTRAKVLNHNSKLGKMAAADAKSTAIVPDAYRDQGLFRTKVLIVVPFRESALRIVNNFIALLFPQQATGANTANQVMHYKRFLEEFSGQSLHFPKRNPKPEDYEQTFAGNSDDTFRIGVAFTRKCMKLYTDFYSSDVLIVSPLGLRMIVGAPGDKERDYDFLASIELLILDQADIFVAQNWDHILHVLDHLHLQPQSARNTDFSRVRSWCLNGWSRFYRQTLMFTSHELPEFRSLFKTRLSNYRGKVRIGNPIEGGSIKHVAVQIAQVFRRVDVSSIQSSFDERFEHFVNNILPQYKSASMAHCLVFIPSYFDFVRIRNYFKRETLNFVQICEYTKVS